MFVANPAEAGDGPGGVQLLSAARLSGRGTLNNAGLLTIGQTDEVSSGSALAFVMLCTHGPKLHTRELTPGACISAFTCLDHTMNSGSNTIERGEGPIVAQLQRVVAGMASPSTLRLAHAAALNCAVNTTRVVLVGDGGTVCVSRDVSRETVMQFFDKIAVALELQAPVLFPPLTALSEAAGARAAGARVSPSCALFTGSRDRLEDLVRANEELLKATRMVVVDVTSGDSDARVIEVASGVDATVEVLFARGCGSAQAPTWPGDGAVLA